MGAKKIKLPKKPTGKAVQIELTYAEQVKTWAEKNFTLIVGVTAAIFFLIVSTWGLKAYNAYNENSARAAYSKIAGKLPTEEKAATPEELQKLIPDLQKFTSEHKGTQTAIIAQIELAKAFFASKRYDDAIKTASEALKKVPADNGLKPLILYQLAFAYEAAGKQEQALMEWLQLKDSGIAGLQRESEWNASRIYAAMKDYAKAEDMLSKAMEAPGSYPSQALLEQELARVKQASGK